MFSAKQPKTIRQIYANRFLVYTLEQPMTTEQSGKTITMATVSQSKLSCCFPCAASQIVYCEYFHYQGDMTKVAVSSHQAASSISVLPEASVSVMDASQDVSKYLVKSFVHPLATHCCCLLVVVQCTAVVSFSVVMNFCCFA